MMKKSTFLFISGPKDLCNHHQTVELVTAETGDTVLNQDKFQTLDMTQDKLKNIANQVHDKLEDVIKNIK